MMNVASRCLGLIKSNVCVRTVKYRTVHHLPCATVACRRIFLAENLTVLNCEGARPEREKLDGKLPCAAPESLNIGIPCFTKFTTVGLSELSCNFKAY